MAPASLCPLAAWLQIHLPLPFAGRPAAILAVLRVIPLRGGRLIFCPPGCLSVAFALASAADGSSGAVITSIPLRRSFIARILPQSAASRGLLAS